MTHPQNPATPDTADTPTAPPAAAFDDPAYETITRMVDFLGLALIPMPTGTKWPPPVGFPTRLGLSVDDAYDHHAAGGNLAAVMGTSRTVWIDCENAAATAAILRAGGVPFAIPAKAQYDHDVLATVPGDDDSGKPNTKRGGVHVGLALPAHIDPKALPHDTIGIELEGGGVVDVLAGNRYAMVPPSRLAVAPGVAYAPAAGGSLDPALDCPDVLPEAWPWLFDRSVPCPEGLEPLHGILTPKPPREKIEKDAKSSELDRMIDEIPWDQWLMGAGKIVYTGRHSGCGCPEYHYIGADHAKSLTLHEGCGEAGWGAHVWSGTMIRAEGLDGDHLSRAQLRMALTGETFKEACESVGLELGDDSDNRTLTGLSADMFDEHAERAEERGDQAHATELRKVADTLREAAGVRREQAIANGEVFDLGPVVGAPPLRVVEGGAQDAPPPKATTNPASASAGPNPIADEGKVDLSQETDIDAGIPDDKMKAWAKVKAKGFDPTNRAVYPLGFHSTPEIIAGVMDYSDRTRALFHKARSERNVHPIGLYLMDLIRFGNRLPTDLGPYPGAPLSTYVVLVGRAGTGKTQTGRADLSPNDWNTLGVVRRNFEDGSWEYPLTGADVATTHRLGSGQVLVDLYGGSEPVFNEDTGAQLKGQKKFKPNDHRSIHVHEDELSAFIARSTGPQNTSLQTVCSAWARADIGDSSRTAGPKLTLCGSVSPYNLFMSSGLQPKKSGPYFASEGVGYVQRNIHSAVTDPYRKVGLPVLADPGPQPAPTVVLRDETVFILCESIRVAMDENEEDGSIDTLVGASDLDSHLLMVRVRLACLVAAYHGSLTVTEECWEHTGWIMEHARRSRAYCEAAKDHAAEDEAGDVEKLRKHGQRVANATDRERVEACAQRIITKIIESGDAGVTEGEARQHLGGARRKGQPSERDLYAADAIKVVKATESIAFDGTRFRLATLVSQQGVVPHIGNVA